MRVQNTTPLTKQVKSDLDLLIESHPEGFDAILFKAISSKKENLANLEQDVVTSLEAKELTIEYQEPQIVAALEPTQDIRSYPGLSDGMGYGLIQEEGHYKLLIAGTVPKHSVVAFVVQQNDESYVLRVLYVLNLRALGRKAQVGYLYSLIPYTGGDHQIKDATPNQQDIVDLVAEILENMQPPDTDQLPDDLEEDTQEAGQDSGFTMFEPN